MVLMLVAKTNVLQAFDYMKKRILVSDDSKKNSPIDEENMYSFYDK